MLNRSLRQHASKWLAVAALLGCGLAFGPSAIAQSEPTLNQVYATAQAGRLDEAQVMMQQVLVAHPGSAKAHFVQAELFARQGRLDRAREALGTAEKLAPGLPFAKPEAVQALRAQLAARSSPPAPHTAVAHPAVAAAPAPASSFPWGLALLLGGGLVAFGIYRLGKKAPAAPVPQGSGLSGPQSFGMGNGGGTMAPAYPQPAYAPPAYGPPAGSGLGGKVMGGLATGLAVGAGVMAAQAIGKSLMGGEQHPQYPNDNTTGRDYAPPAVNSDLGGDNFGVNDAGSWDDGGALASSDGGGDWDS